MSKHTPGPWEVIGHPDDDECRVRQTESVRHGDGFYSERTICEQISVMANANLIAAAPDLLEALELIVREQLVSADGEFGKAVFSAIAKATGEQQ